MSLVTWALIVTFGHTGTGIGGADAITATSIKGYNSKSNCEAAAKMISAGWDERSGVQQIHWVCIPDA